MVQKLALEQAAVYNGFIYAATINGIRELLCSNKNLVDYKQWGLVATEWSGITFGSVCLLLMWREKLINMTLIPILS
jgi:hypothetical protein